MSEHDQHIAAELPAVGDHIEARLESQYGRRAHFVCLAWSGNTVQMITNTLRPGLAAHRGH